MKNRIQEIKEPNGTKERFCDDPPRKTCGCWRNQRSKIKPSGHRWPVLGDHHGALLIASSV